MPMERTWQRESPRQREKMRDIRPLHEATLQFLLRFVVPADIDVDSGEVKARPEQVRIEV